jgi:hypothetical protein
LFTDSPISARVPAPDEHVGEKWRLRYRSPIRGDGNLKVDISFMFRVPLPPLQSFQLARFGLRADQQIPLLNIRELAAGKLVALFSRRAAETCSTLTNYSVETI